MENLLNDVTQRMDKSLSALRSAFNKIRTGRANPAILDDVNVDYYGNMTPINQTSNISIEEGRSIVISPWDKNLIPEIEKAILKSALGLNPSSSSDSIRLPMPPLTEENRKDLARIARSEAENARIAVRNIRRDANGDLKEFLKEKEITEDEQRRGEENIQKLTDAKIKKVEVALTAKEADLMEF